MKFRGILSLLIALSLNSVFAAPDPTPFLEVIGVAANTHRSSGGHSALRIGNQVYQYQAAGDKMLFLQRDPWPSFERRYRKLDNRSLTLVRLDLKPTDIQRITSRFNRIFAVQNKYITRWEALKIEQTWFEALSKKKSSVSIPTIGYFDSTSRKNEHTRRLRIIAEKSLGKAIISDELSKVNATLIKNALKTSLCNNNEIKIDNFPTRSEIAAEHRLEQLSLREALLILKQDRGASPAMMIAPDDRELSETDRFQLTQLAHRIELSVPRLLSSSRPDRGPPLLLAIARYGAISQSLNSNRLLLLDVFPSVEESITLLDARQTRRHRKFLTALSNQAGEVWKEERQLFMDPREALTEYGYQRMENAAARYIIPRDAIQNGRPLLSCNSDLLRPDRHGTTTPLKSLPLSILVLEKTKQQSKLSYQNFLMDLRQAYGYSLLQHNCTTELANAIQSSFEDNEEIRKSLNAVIDPKKGLTLIPANFTRKVRQQWKITNVRVLPSHRQEQSAKLTNRNPSPLIALRESNRWTSTVYPGSIHDDAFLFFADGNPLYRPLQGSANLLFGMTHTGLGLITLPSERGPLLIKKGLNGIFYSVPEIFGISIRKGRYDILPRDKSAVSE